MIQALLDLIAHHMGIALVIVFAISLGEALFVVGLFVPSTVVLVAAGGLVGTGQLPFLPVLFLAASGAAVGDALSYWFGHHHKEGVRLIWPFSRFLGLMDKGEAFFRHHGGKSIFIGRFIPGIKAIVPGVAGMTGMNFAWFSIVNVVSAIVWAAAHIVPAAGVGRSLSRHLDIDIKTVAVGLVILIVGICLYLALKRRLWT